MASVYATIANGGVRVQPSIVAGTTNASDAATDGSASAAWTPGGGPSVFAPPSYDPQNNWVLAVTGVAGDPLTYYFGSVAGGVLWFAIAATGLVVTYTTSGVFNFAQGAVGMVAAFCYWGLVTQDHVAILVALLIILVFGASISGALVERVLMRRLHGASPERPVMVTLGLLVILTGFATVTWSPSTQHLVGNMVNGQFRLVSINIQYQEVLIIGVALAVAVALRRAAEARLTAGAA